MAPAPSAQEMQVCDVSQRTETSNPERNDSKANSKSQSQRKEEVSQRSASSGGGGDETMKAKKGSSSAKVAPEKRVESYKGGSRLLSVRSADSDPNVYKSGRGHDFEGGGIGVANGQLEQAKDRNFDAVFERCRLAGEAIAAVRPVVCVEEAQELQKLVKLVEGMLSYLEHLFHDNTAKTIVSLKQLCNQLEAAAEVIEQATVAPSFCARLCGGAAAAEQAEKAKLKEKTKIVQTYAVSMLLEHGFKASDLTEFANRGRHSTYESDRGASEDDSAAPQDPKLHRVVEITERSSLDASSVAGENGRSPSESEKVHNRDGPSLSLDDASAGMII